MWRILLNREKRVMHDSLEVCKNVIHGKQCTQCTGYVKGARLTRATGTRMVLRVRKQAYLFLSPWFYMFKYSKRIVTYSIVNV